MSDRQNTLFELEYGKRNNQNFFLNFGSCLVGKSAAHWKPDVFALRRVVEELMSLSLRIVAPVSGAAVVNPCALDVFSRDMLNELGAGKRAEVPCGLDVLVLSKVLHQVITVASQNVNDAGREIGSFKN